MAMTAKTLAETATLCIGDLKFGEMELEQYLACFRVSRFLSDCWAFLLE